jgi:hypothetical protein
MRGKREGKEIGNIRAEGRNEEKERKGCGKKKMRRKRGEKKIQRIRM